MLFDNIARSRYINHEYALCWNSGRNFIEWVRREYAREIGADWYDKDYFEDQRGLFDIDWTKGPISALKGITDDQMEEKA